MRIAHSAATFSESKTQLIRGLTLTSTTALVIGSIIGTGLFFKAAMSRAGRQAEGLTPPHRAF